MRGADVGQRPSPDGEEPQRDLPPMTVRSVLTSFSASMGRFVQYQLAVAALVAFVLMPLFHLTTNWLIHLSGREAISSGDYLMFLLSVEGIAAIIVGLAVLGTLIVLTINGLVLISAEALRGDPNPGVKAHIGASLASARHFAQPAAILIFLYVGVVVPLSGVGIGVEALDGLSIPNFVTSVIHANPLYNAAYTGVLVILALLGVLGAFVFHSVLLDDSSVWGGMKASAHLIWTFLRTLAWGPWRIF